MTLTDDERERIAIEVEHLPEGESAAEYERRVRYALNRRRLRERLAKQSGGIYIAAGDEVELT